MKASASHFDRSRMEHFNRVSRYPILNSFADRRSPLPSVQPVGDRLNGPDPLSLPVRPATPIKHTTLPISHRAPLDRQHHLIRREARAVRRLYVAVMGLLAVGMAVAIPIIGKNIWLGMTTPVETRP